MTLLRKKWKILLEAVCVEYIPQREATEVIVET